MWLKARRGSARLSSGYCFFPGPNTPCYDPLRDAIAYSSSVVVAMTSVLSPPAVIGAKRASTAPKKEIWSSLLNSVSSGKRLAEKQLVVLGKGIGVLVPRRLISMA
jgi:hypothetical protein